MPPRPRATAAGSRRFLGMVAGLSLAAAALMPRVPAGAADASLEYDVKAAFIYNFAKFTEWPEGSLRDQVLRVGIVGKDPFDGRIDRCMDGKTVHGARLLVRRLEGLEGAGECDLLFVPASEDQRLGEILGRVRGLPVLTVGETEAFARGGGIIRLKLARNRVRFEVDAAAAAASHLRLSSKLLQVADAVRTDRPAESH